MWWRVITAGVLVIFLSGSPVMWGHPGTRTADTPRVFPWRTLDEVASASVGMDTSVCPGGELVGIAYAKSGEDAYTIFLTKDRWVAGEYQAAREGTPPTRLWLGVLQKDTLLLIKDVLWAERGALMEPCDWLVVPR